MAPGGGLPGVGLPGVGLPGVGLDQSRVVRLRVASSGGIDPARPLWRFSSGYLVAPGRVLTAAHALVPPGRDASAESATRGDACEVLPWDKEAEGRWVAGIVVWVGADHDIAIVSVDDMIRDVPVSQLGRLEGAAPVEWVAVGFPVAGRGRTRREVEHAFGEVSPISLAQGERLALTLRSRRPRTHPGWAGLSGAAVFCGGCLVGVVTSDPNQWKKSLEAARIAAVTDDRGFREAVGQRLIVKQVRAGHDQGVWLQWPASWNVPLVLSDDGGLGELRSQARPASGSRDQELAAIIELLDGPGGGAVLVTGDAFRGKTTVMGELTRRLSDRGRDVVVLVNVRNAGHLPTRPLEVLNGQLMQLLDADCGLADSDHLVAQYRALRDHAARQRQQLVVMIDALDEAPSPEALLAALSLPPPPGCWVVVSSRPNPPLPPAHYLARLPARCVLELREVREAVERKEAADAWIEAITSSSDHLEHRLFAAIVAAGAALSRPELADLLEVERADVNRVLEQERHRPWFTRADEHGRSRLGHAYLPPALAQELGTAAMRSADGRLRAWAERYRRAGWPAETPRYLLEHLLTRPTPTGGAGALSLEERVQLLRDERWTRRRYARLGQRRTLIELGIRALDELASQHTTGTDRFPEMVALAVSVCHWRHKAKTPTAEVIAAYASQGSIDRAVDLARDALTTAYNPEALLTLATHPNVPVDVRGSLLAEARQLASQLYLRARARWLMAIAEAGDRTALDDALQLTELLLPADRTRLLGRIVQALVAQGRLDEARQLAGQPQLVDRAEAMAAFAVGGDLTALDEVHQLTPNLDEARKFGQDPLLVDEHRAKVLIAMAEAGDSSAFDEAYQLAPRIARYQSGLVAAIGRALVTAGRHDEARQLADKLYGSDQAEVLVALARAGAPAALDAASYEPIYRYDAVRAIASALRAFGRVDEAHQVGDLIARAQRKWMPPATGDAVAASEGIDETRHVPDQPDRWGQKEWVRDATARARELVASGQVEEAYEFARMGISWLRWPVIAATAEALAESDRFDEATELAGRMRRYQKSIDDVSRALAAVMTGFVAAGRLDEARQLADADGLSYFDKTWALVAIAKAGHLGALDEAIARERGPFGSAEAQAAIAKILVGLGRVDQAWQLAHERGPEKGPARPVLAAIGQALVGLGRVDEARQLADQLDSEDRTFEIPDQTFMLQVIARALVTSGRPEEARQLAAEFDDNDRIWVLKGIADQMAQEANLSTPARRTESECVLVRMLADS